MPTNLVKAPNIPLFNRYIVPTKTKMKLKATLLAIASISFANAATITVTNVDFTLTNAVVNSTGTTYSVGTGIIGLGTFSISDSAISGAANVSTLASAFNLFGSSSTFGSGFSIAGTFQFDTTAPITSSPSGSMYTFIGNGTTFANSSEVLVYKNATSFAADPTPNENAILKQSTGGTLLVGGYNNFQANIGLGSASAYNTVSFVP
ncbi:MAG: hypothetical protein ABI162_08160, partial [Luteolibacter sp.]